MPLVKTHHCMLKLVLDTLGARVHTVEGIGKIIDLFLDHGHNEIDTARMYGWGTTEKMLGTFGWADRGIVMDTKLYPTGSWPVPDDIKYTHKADDVRKGFMDSLEALKTEKVDLFYLHAPDRTTPFEDTLREVNKLHSEGRFHRFGISNFMSWEVAQVCEICEKNGWIKPTVYQGVYHALQRSIEAELFPCLHHYGISLYAFQPLAGGMLTGRYAREQVDFEPGSRFDPKILQGGIHRQRYWNGSYFDAIDTIRTAGEKHKLSCAEVALRWLQHHSQLKKDLGDAIIVGASSTKHLEENLADLEKGPLPDDVVEAVEDAWRQTKAIAPKYWH